MNGTALIRGLAATAATALTTLAIPDIAGAADYCVGQGLGCDDPHTVQSLDVALDRADDDALADRILLSAGVHVPSNGFSFRYHRLDGSVEIVGKGAGETIITRPSGASGEVLALDGAPGTSIHDVTLRVPENATNAPRALGTSNLAHHVAVDEHSNQVSVQQRFGVDLYGGGRLEDASVILDDAEDTTGVSVYDGGASIRRTNVIASTGVYLYADDGATVERSRITASYVGVHAYKGDNTIASTLIRFGENAGITATTVGGSGSDTTLDADGVTLVGAGMPWSYGASASNASNPARNATVNLRNSIVRGAASPFYASSKAGATGKVTVAASYSDYDPTGNSTEDGASINESNVSNVGDAGFVNAAAGDYHLLSSSPLIDAGDPATAQGLDLDGNPLVTDGNHDGTARRDLGAYEVSGPLPGPGAGGGQTGGQPAIDSAAPVISLFRATPTRRGARFRYTLSESAKVTLKVQRAIRGSRTRYRTIGTLTRTAASGANSARLRGRLARRVRISGRYRVRITAADTAGNRAAPKLARFRVLPRA